MLGLALTAGGARGAYQAGVLKRIGEMRSLREQPSPFSILTGASAGAINGVMVAAGADDFRRATRLLAQLWSELKVRDVFRADPLSLGVTGARLVRDLSLGGLLGGAGMHSLFDASPLRKFLSRQLALDRIGAAIRSGHLYAVAITATSYHSGRSFTFIQGRHGHPLWTRSRRVTLPVELTLDHVLASAAIPIIFQPVRLQTAAGDLYFGDGALRLVNPLSPAIRLGARRVLAIGIRCRQAAADLWQTELGSDGGGNGHSVAQPPLSQICGVILNAIFLDHLDADLDHLLRMNELIQVYGQAGVPQHTEDGVSMNEPMRIVTPLVINPSADLAIVAKECAHAMPCLVRYILDGLGRPDAQSADLLSYLLFDGKYTRALVDIGYRDAAKRIDEIEAFIFGEAHVRPSRPARRRRRPPPSHLRAVS